MLMLTQDVVIVCRHQLGIANVPPTQVLVTVEQRRIFVDNDPEAKSIAGCPHLGPGIKPCTTTLKVKTGYSTLVRIAGHSVCLDTVSGLTDGTPPGTVKYVVHTPGQSFVSSTE
jgi:hypothetical protein